MHCIIQTSGRCCFVLDLEPSLLSLEKLDRSSPDLWPEQSMITLYQTYTLHLGINNRDLNN